MKALNFDRLRNVARWDVTVNRSFYLKMVRLVAGCVFVPILIRYMGGILKLLFAGGRTLGQVDTITDVKDLISLLFVVLQVMALGYVFHNLSTRKGRIAELMLPASNMERFVWHVLVGTVGYWLVFLLSVLTADVLHVFLGWIVMGQTSFSSLTACLLACDDFSSMIQFDPSMEFATDLALEVLGCIMTCAFFSTFVLGNAWKYRHNVSYTLFCHLGVAVAFLVVAGIFMTRIVCQLDPRNLHIDEEMIRNIGVWASPIALLFFLVLLALIWWAAYRLYCRAELTSKRNP